MTDLASQADVNATETHAAADQKPGLLTIPGGAPITLYINAKRSGDVFIAGFGLTSHGPFYTGGVTWSSVGEYAMFVKFHFLKHVTGIDCDALPYSPVYSGKQDLCILAAAPATYPFYVYFDDNTRHDPQIIVTPPSDPKP